MQFEVRTGLTYNQRVLEHRESVIDATTRFCAVYGHPVRHSASPAMQNAAIAALNLNWRYLAFDVPPEGLAKAIAGTKAMGFIGLNLTLPHKLLALPMVDQLDASGEKFGAINTIRFEARDQSGAWRPIGLIDPGSEREVRSVGFNTDADALVQALREDLQMHLAGASVLLLGVGGAGLVAALRLAEEGLKALFLVNRTAAKAEELAGQLRQRFPNTAVELGYPPGPVDLVLNATSLGLKVEDPLPLDERRYPLHQAGAVYDMVYRPAQTKLLEAARKAGRPAANGLGMLLYQGAKALEIWTERPAPVAVMRAALERAVYGR